MSPFMETALLTMVTVLFLTVLGTMFVQRRESAKIREKLDETNKAVADLASRTAALEANHQHLIESIREHGRDLAGSGGSLTKIRERLARIEGHLGIGLPPNSSPSDPQDD